MGPQLVFQKRFGSNFNPHTQVKNFQETLETKLFSSIPKSKCSIQIVERQANYSIKEHVVSFAQENEGGDDQAITPGNHRYRQGFEFGVWSLELGVWNGWPRYFRQSEEGLVWESGG